MDPLYKIIKQLSEVEFEDIYQNLTSNKADKSALFLKTIRESDNPVEDFLEKQEISASAFYVLKSRLNQKIESFLLNRLGDPKMEAIHKVFKVYDLMFNSPREISITTLKRLERTMIEIDNPLVLMVVYRALKMLHNYDDNERNEYERLYNQAVAFSLTAEKAMDSVMTFFRVYDRYYLGRKEKDLLELVRGIEKINNLNNLYQSQRLFICQAVVQLFARRFLNMPRQINEVLLPEDEVFERSFHILEKSQEDILFKNLNLVFDYLRYCHLREQGEKAADQAQIYYELLDYKIEELLSNFNFGMDCSQMLFFKLEHHLKTGDIKKLQDDNTSFISKIEVDPYRLVPYVNFNLFQAYVSYYGGNWEETSRLLYRMRNKVNLRKYPHMDLEVKLFLAFSYVMQEETDLANQLILSLQRQLKKGEADEYENARVLLKIMSARLSSKSGRKAETLRKMVEEYREINKGKYAILPHLDISFALFNSDQDFNN